MDKLKALQNFIAIVDHGSLTAAAEAQGTSLTAVVRSLAALESSLGARLLNRTTRRLALTPDGRQYLERARRLLADLDEADRLLSTRQEEPRGMLSVTAPVQFGQYHVAPAVTRFLQRHPQVHINLVLLDRVTNLVEEGMDVGVRIGELQDSSLVAQGVGKVRRVVVASPAWLKRHGIPAHPQALARQPCLYDTHSGNRWTFLGENGRPLTVAVHGPLVCSLVAPTLEACAEGLGFARCLLYQANTLLKARKLRIVLADFEPEPWPVSITYPSARLLPSRTRLFIEWLKQSLQESGVV